jgi:hypothetical protein
MAWDFPQVNARSLGQRLQFFPFLTWLEKVCLLQSSHEGCTLVRSLMGVQIRNLLLLSEAEVSKASP